MLRSPTGEKMDAAARKAYNLAVGYQSAALGAYDYAFGLDAVNTIQRRVLIRCRRWRLGWITLRCLPLCLTHPPAAAAAVAAVPVAVAEAVPVLVTGEPVSRSGRPASRSGISWSTPAKRPT